jgi:hypothetical protein
LNSSRRYRYADDSSPAEKRPFRPSSLSEADDEEEEDDTADSDFSTWTDTGDLGDQLFDQEDPLSAALASELPNRSRDRGTVAGAARLPGSARKKKVRYDISESEGEKKRTGVVKRKEDIAIPSPPPRRIPLGERILVLIMAPNDGPSRMHGLHGKKLMYDEMNWESLTCADLETDTLLLYLYH